jgi:NADH dehydrogenase [ubiquinone] 1 alpha subcomplex assembly factor 7
MPEKNNLSAKTKDLPVSRSLAAEIEKNGPMPVAAFMGAAAAHYYATKDPFGTEGDFTTAPEISQMFGEMIGAWLVDVWMQMGQPEKVQLIELGPGRGTLMADIMRTVSSWPEFKAAVTIHMIETSPQLRQAQANVLKAYRPTWYDRLEEVPIGVSLIVANEFFDALPIHQFKKTKGAWQERAVGYDPLEDNFFFTTVPLSFDIATLMPPEFLEMPDGCIFEVSPASLGVMDVLCRRIADHSGAALIVDYGHTVPGLGDTLQSVSRHKYSDVLDNPGGKDITAHVDFSTLKTVAQEIVEVHGAVTQAAFLKSLGIEQRAEKLAVGATDEQKRDIATGLHRLTASAEMGHFFKVMGLTPKSLEIIPAGFNDEISDNPA